MTDRELDRRAAHRLAVIRHAQEVTGNVSKTCRYYGITRQSYYKWLRRYEAGGITALRDGSSRPHTSPRATSADDPSRVQIPPSPPPITIECRIVPSPPGSPRPLSSE